MDPLRKQWARSDVESDGQRISGAIHQDMKFIRLSPLIALAAGTAFLSASANAAQTGDDVECYDALVSARIVRQTPSTIGDCGPDCIIMVWPWFMQLNVKKVIEGDAPKGRMLALTMQHTYYRKNLGTVRWWLRRNSLGSFNILRFAEDNDTNRCPTGTLPAKPYIQPSDGKMLEDLLHESERDGGGRS